LHGSVAAILIAWPPAIPHWAQVHGLAGLLVDGPLGQHLPGQPERLAFAREATAL
jgi:hypothetical protein